MPSSSHKSKISLNDQEYWLIAMIGKPHGLKGACHIHYFGHDYHDIPRYNPLYAPDGTPYNITINNVKKTAKHSSSLLICSIKDIDTIEQIQTSIHTPLYVDVMKLASCENDEIYIEQLIGYRIIIEDTCYKGSVIAYHYYGAGDILECMIHDPSFKETLLIPFNDCAIKHIDHTQRLLTLYKTLL